MTRNFVFKLKRGTVVSILALLFVDPLQTDVFSIFSDKRLTIQDFRSQENFWTAQQAEVRVNAGALGRTPERAVVPLVFNLQGFLLTAREFNQHRFAQTRWFYTDLATFYRITREHTATPAYAKVLTEHRGDALYVYDPYATPQQTPEEEVCAWEEAMQAEGRQRGAIDFSRLEEERIGFEAGDILIRPNIPIWNIFGSTSTPPKSIGGGWGHATGISRPSAPGSDLLSSLASAWVIEAWGGEVERCCQIRETRACVPGKSSTCYKNPIENDNYWCKKRKGSRFRLRMNAPKTQRDAIAAFLRQQDEEDDRYSPFTKKRFPCTPTMSGSGCRQKRLPACATGEWANSDRWYCSLLVWQAYFYVTGVDIDVNGGAYVFPNDIIKSPVFNNTTNDQERRVRF